MEKTNQQYNVTTEPVTPSHDIKRYIVQLSKDCTGHLARSMKEKSEKHAFAVKTKALSILMEKYTDREVKKITFEHFKKMDEAIKKIRQNDKLHEQTRSENILKIRYDYALPVFEQNLRILQNSPITETESHGIIDINNEGIEKRIQGDLPILPLRGR